MLIPGAPPRTASSAFCERVDAIIRPYFDEARGDVLESVCRRMLGISPGELTGDQLGSLAYWLKIYVRSKRLLSDAQLASLVDELEAVRSDAPEILRRARVPRKRESPWLSQTTKTHSLAPDVRSTDETAERGRR